MENTNNIKDLIQKFYPYAKNALGFEHPVRVIMRKDAENAENPLGKTAYYDPEQKLIVLYVVNRHPKDVLRSFSHELVHHAQNCRGDLDDMTTQGHYAKDGKGREIEKEAYLQGNLNVRDYEDTLKFEGENQMNEHYQMAKEELKKLVAETYKEVLDEKKKKKKKEFPDLTGDGKVTQADILKGRGVDLDEGTDADEEANRIELEKARELSARVAANLKEADLPSRCKAIRDKESKLTIAGYKAEREGNPFFQQYFGEARNLRDDNKECFPEWFEDETPAPGQSGMDITKKQYGLEEGIKEEKVDEVDQEDAEEELAAAQKLAGKFKKDKKKEKKKFKPSRPSRPAYPGDTHFYGDDPRQFAPPLPEGIKESKQEEKQVVTETPQPPEEVKETNKAWYNSSLYAKLKSKWTK